jgi:hypothetical protein
MTSLLPKYNYKNENKYLRFDTIYKWVLPLFWKSTIFFEKHHATYEVLEINFHRLQGFEHFTK